MAVTEWTNYTLAVRFKAAAMGVPFLPVRSLLGTDTFKHSAACVVACPFTGERLAALPALYPDVAVIHVHEADRYGNSRLRGTTVADLDLARAAKKLIITCERLIPPDEIRRDPSLTAIPFWCVDAVWRGALRQLSRQHALRVFFRRGPPGPLAGGGNRPRRPRGIPEDAHLRCQGLRGVSATLRRLARMQELRRQELLLDREGQTKTIELQ